MVTEEEYLRMEDASESKHEFENGEVIDLPGVTVEHDRVTIALLCELRDELRGDDGRLFSSSVRVRAAGRTYYPDLSISLSPRINRHDPPSLLNPCVVFEILSAETEGRDRGVKFAAYRQIPEMREYVLVHTDQPLVELHRKVDEGWLLVEFRGVDAELPLLSLDIRLPFAKIYARRIAENWADDPEG